MRFFSLSNWRRKLLLVVIAYFVLGFVALNILFLYGAASIQPKHDLVAFWLLRDGTVDNAYFLLLFWPLIVFLGIIGGFS